VTGAKFALNAKAQKPKITVHIGVVTDAIMNGDFASFKYY